MIGQSVPIPQVIGTETVFGAFASIPGILFPKKKSLKVLKIFALEK